MALMECVTVESGVWVCVASVCVCAAECIGEMEHDLPSHPLECASLMNSSVTQLIAEPATDLAAASSPRDPSAGFIEARPCLHHSAGTHGGAGTHELIVFVAVRAPFDGS